MLIALVVAILASGGCTGRPQGSPDGTREVRLGDMPWIVLLAGPDGMRGLRDFAGADGMLFDFDQDIDPDAVAFVMDGVAFPLDIAWFTDAGDLVDVASMAVCPARPCPTYTADGPYRWAIEAPVGAFDDLPPDARLMVSPPD
ncbi:MAG TPA: DUF192 domain-containing protein [Candidatus Limnocylindrales bacterium]